MEHSVKIYSRIGELMQGSLSDGRAFMVSGFSSVQWYSEAWLEEDRGEGHAPLPPKARRALSLLLERADAALGGMRVGLRSNIPPGKGLSSSSTDILSVLSVVNDRLGLGLPDEELYSIASRVEPTDPCLSDAIFLFYHQSGIIGQTIGLPPMSLLYFDADPTRRIETEGVRRDWTPGLGKFFDWLVGKFLRAAAEKDYDTLFDCITASAEFNQTVVALPRFEEWVRLARETSSGLMVAHSGTIAGLLTPPERAASMRTRLEGMTGVPVLAEHYSPVLTGPPPAARPKI